MHTIRVILGGLAALLLALAPQLAKAQDFPTRPIRIVVAFPPGGPTDFVGRLVADKMSSILGQRVYIDNKPGANGTLGGGDVAKSDPDGYSLFLTTSGAVTVSPHMMAKMPFDTFRDFAPVAMVTTVHEVLVVSPKLGVKNVKELVAARQAKTRRRHLRIDRCGLAAASRPVAARRRRRREIPPRTLSGRRTGADRSARRSGASGRARYSGGDLANPGWQSGADRHRRRQARRRAARRADACRTGLSPIPTRRTGMRCWRRQRHRSR